ncbi:glycosyltransferase [bacterium]|nr:glycosyltransferase [bacterium]MDB4744140.1 glycosyltransferase [Verrucomicrobiota bacterium]MDC0317863.1 glycosyltransferase [bacterium]
MSKKKKILVHSNFCKAFTGFGKHKKNLLKYLYKTGKYEIVELVNATVEGDEKLNQLPWRAVGTLPNDGMRLQKLKSDPTKWRNAGYGHELIDEIVKKEKPDIYLGIEDIWAFSGFNGKEWWNKVNCVVHTTLDSLPILPEAEKMAPDIKNYYVWASFAERALHKAGHNHVKTIHGILDTDNFRRLSQEKIITLRKKFNLSESFLIGFVFRNQLRKSVPNILDGFNLFKNKNPKANAKLLLHTHWSEGWDIPRLIKEKGINAKDIVTTYFCKVCKQYIVANFTGQKINCPNCSSEKTLETTNISNGVNEAQLNEIYNLLDVYCHPFTSGGQEIPIQEAKLTELITLATNYSCGEDSCCKGSGGLPLEWAEYREPGTQFIKATTRPDSICKQLQKVFSMKPSKKTQMGKQARKYVIDNYSAEVVGKKFDTLFESFDFVDWDKINLSFKKRDTQYEPDDRLSDSDWLIDLYKNCLMVDLDGLDSGHQYWMKQFANKKNRHQVLSYFHGVALKENSQKEAKDLTNTVDRDRPSKRIAYVMPEHSEDIICSISVVKSLKQNYPDHDIYFFTKKMYYSLIDHCDSIYKMCEYTDDIDHDCFKLVGKADQKGLFDMAFFPYKETKRTGDYINHGRVKLQYDIT